MSSKPMVLKILYKDLLKKNQDFSDYFFSFFQMKVTSLHWMEENHSYNLD